MPKVKSLGKAIPCMPLIRPFYLKRMEDVSGTSGVGIVAVGAILPSGKCVLEWLSSETTDTFFENIDQVERIHGHDGRTEVCMGDVSFVPKKEDSPKKKK